MRETDFYTSHEACCCRYEEAMTRVRFNTGDWYASRAICSGSATAPASPMARMSNSARHQNPLGIKCGPDASTQTDLLRLLESLDPTTRPGRLTLIARMGATRCSEQLPRAASAR